MDFYNICCKYLKEIELTREDYSADRNSPQYNLFCSHHINPKFNKGGDEPENLVLLHYFEHAYVHLFRWLITDNPRDLGGFTSAMNAKERRELQIEKRRENPPKLTLPPLPPPAEERKKPAKTAKAIRAGKAVGSKYQLQSLKRANPFTMFMANLVLKFINNNGIEVIHKPSDNIKDVSVNSASAIGRALNNVYPTETLTNSPDGISKLLKGTNKIVQNWRIDSLFIDDFEYEITQEVLLKYQDLFETLTTYFSENQELSILELTKSMADIRNSNPKEIALIQKMFTFIKKWSFLIKSLSEGKADDEIDLPTD
uniref:Uncharacterized 35.9 kDa protein in psbA intron 2 n=2 Tax=Chlamydomonas moewusii TaxID=3054 RepID=YCX2_CHLMO|nr:RecName: Full=Uncharacterized 35.9 kDa protein in psbA intron 2 [Chlamydomonas moewusii]ABU88307.1 putative DNA endonuclease [Chlamydomonas moewusii]CAA31843.1 unnamed protein product [Chlamydomonas moewusii]CAA33624.1 unnamed protein product [Chlamydomonas moewusii]